MKHILLIGMLWTGIVVAHAQQTDTAKSDTPKKKELSLSINIGGNKTDSAKKVTKSTGGYFKLTFSRLDLGFIKLLDNGKTKLSPANSFLDYGAWSSRNVGFDILELGYRLSKHFKIYVSGGFDWNHLRLQDNITILRDQPVLSYSTDTIDYKKNRFTSSYLRVPLSFEFKTNNLRLVIGSDAGFLMNGRVKQKSEENGKQKFDDDYHFSQFRHGTFVRIGNNSSGAYIKYYSNDMFEDSPAQKGLKYTTFGFTQVF